MDRPAPSSGPPRIGKSPIRVMIVDDSLVARTVLSRIIYVLVGLSALWQIVPLVSGNANRA